MKSIVIIRQTPDTEAKINVASSGDSIDPEGIKWIMNPYDEFAVEEAIRLKEKNGGEVILIAMGPGRSIEALRTGLAMGADSAIHIKDDSFAFSDPFAIGKVIAQEIRNVGDYDIILTGKKMIDEETGQVGIQVAQELGIPHVSIVTNLEVNAEGKTAKAEKEIEGGQMVVEVPLPSLITCEKGLNEPRYASLPGIMKAKKKPVKEVAIADIDAGATGLSAEALGKAGARIVNTKYEIPSIERKLTVLKGSQSDMVKDAEIQSTSSELVRLLREEAKVI